MFIEFNSVNQTIFIENPETAHKKVYTKPLNQEIE